jgi:RNA polymerase sigma-70 factor (ECF subfamily)
MNGERRPTSAAAHDLTDAQLLQEIADGDLDSLGTLFDRHHERVTRVLHRSGMAPSDVDDLVQQTFLQVPRVAAAYDGRDSCAAWLCGIAVRLGARRRRSIVRLIRALAAFTTEVRVTTDLDPERILAGREEFALFASALAKLGRKKREAFVLIEIEGFTAEEAGCALGVPAATLRTRLFHARGELRAAMERGMR